VDLHRLGGHGVFRQVNDNVTLKSDEDILAREPQPTGVSRLILLARDLDGSPWVLNEAPLDPAHEVRCVRQEAFQAPDGTVSWRAVEEPCPTPQGKFLCGPTTDTPQGLLALGLRRTSVWRSLKRGWYTLGYHEGGGERIAVGDADATYLQEIEGLSPRAAARAMRVGHFTHRQPPCARLDARLLGSLAR
jgi:hypothetical protein